MPLLAQNSRGKWEPMFSLDGDVRDICSTVEDLVGFQHTLRSFDGGCLGPIRVAGPQS